MGNKSLLKQLSACRKRLNARGFNLWGITRIEEHDAVQCRGMRLGDLREGSASAVVIGSGGRDLWTTLSQAEGFDAAPKRGYHPIDAYSERVLLEEAEHFRSLGYEVCALFPFTNGPVNFLKLAESAGVGVISPVIPFLLHPEFGPWISLRGALIFNRQIPSNGALDDFEPCSSCAAPCVSACPVETYGQGGEVHLDRCADHRDAGSCDTGCEVRRACPIGAEHRYGATEEAFRHAYSLPVLRRWFGLRWWKLVPARLRRRF